MKITTVNDLDNIRRLINHPILDHKDIFKKLQKALTETSYSKKIFRFEIPQIRRAISNPDPAWFNDFSRFGMPPKGIPNMGRCNWKGEPVFYASGDNATTVFEIRAPKGEFVVISDWVNIRLPENANPCDLPIEFFGIPLGVKQMIKGNIKQGYLKRLLREDQIFGKDTPGHIKKIDRYIGKLFSKPVITDEEKKLYRFTGSFIKILFECMKAQDGSRIQGVLYPSVEAKATANNVVFSEAFAQNNLRMYAASMYEVIEFDSVNKEYSLKPLRIVVGKEEDGKPKWKNIHKKHQNDVWKFRPDTDIMDWGNFTPLDLED